MKIVRGGAILACGLMAGSCTPAATEGGFDSPNPAARLQAIEQAARAGDRTAIAQLVEQLDSDDSAVRLMAIITLQRLTGRTFGYRHHDPPDARNSAIERWVRAVQADALSCVPRHGADVAEHDG